MGDVSMEYREGTLHTVMLKIHRDHYTIVFANSITECAHAKGERHSTHYEILGPNGLMTTSFTCCADRAFKDAWDEIKELAP